jgi:hypothetical protein
VGAGGAAEAAVVAGERDAQQPRIGHSNLETKHMISDKRPRSIAATIGAVLMLLAGSAGAAEQAHFPNPQAAADALVAAAGAEDRDLVLAILGPEGEDLRSPDPVADALERKAFVAAAKTATRIDTDGDDFALLSIGKEDWPFPIPLVKGAKGWRFDTAEGIEELFDRRIGRNELNTVAVALEFVEAQYEYESEDYSGDGKREFARKLMSAEGERDGLYWPVAGDGPESPMGRFVAEAVEEGYQPGEGNEPTPYHGYYYRVLTEQGENAPGGAKSYIVDGHMTGGFALLAYPAEYGNSGVMSFLTNQSGILFEKDLGEETATLAAAMTHYNPDHSWRPVTASAP